MMKLRAFPCIRMFVMLLCLTSVAVGRDQFTTLENYTAWVKGDNVRVREKPSTNARVLGFLKIGTPVLCSRVTTEDSRVGDALGRWFLCKAIASESAGWVFGSFIVPADSAERFNEEEYARRLARPGSAGKSFARLVGTTWNDCEPGAMRGCYGIGFTDTSIRTGIGPDQKTYHILSMTETNGQIRIRGTLALSGAMVQNPDETKTFTVMIKSGVTDRITVDGATFYGRLQP